MSDPKNIDGLLARLPQGSLAAQLVDASLREVTPEARAQALAGVLRRRLDELLKNGGKRGEVQDA